MNKTAKAPSVAAIKPAPWSGRYQPMACPTKVARNAPATPSATVRTKPDGLLGPGENIRAIIPATKPTTTIQIIDDMALPASSNSYAPTESVTHFFVKLAFAAPASFLSAAAVLQALVASVSHFFKKLV